MSQTFRNDAYQAHTRCWGMLTENNGIRDSKRTNEKEEGKKSRFKKKKKNKNRSHILVLSHWFPAADYNAEKFICIHMKWCTNYIVWSTTADRKWFSLQRIRCDAYKYTFSLWKRCRSQCVIHFCWWPMWPYYSIPSGSLSSVQSQCSAVVCVCALWGTSQKSPNTSPQKLYIFCTHCPAIYETTNTFR